MAGPLVWSEPSGAEHTQDRGDDSGLQEKPPYTPPPHNPQQHSDYCGHLQVSGNHNLLEPKVVLPHKHCLEKGPAQAVLPA